MSSAFVEFRETLKQYLSVDNDIEMEILPASGRVNIANRVFDYRFQVLKGIPLLHIEFSGCGNNPKYVVQDSEDAWVHYDEDPIHDMNSEELADFCVSFLYTEEPI